MPLLLPLIATTLVSTHTLEQGLGVYADDRDRARQRVFANGTLAFQHPGFLSASTYSLSLRRDHLEDVAAAVPSSDDEEGRTETLEGAASLTATQTWEKLTETRATIGTTRAAETNARSGGLGLSRWFWHESLRASVDLGRSVSEQPASEYLDADHELVELPPETSATSTDLGLRHLATPTTITDYKAGYTAQSNRPAARRLGFGVRQFLRPLAAAVHGDATRHLSVGAVQPTTSYGEVRAVEASAAWLQSLWSGAEARLGYRFYREDETTRATGDELTFGSDTYSLSLAQAFRTDSRRGRLYRLTLRGSRYLANGDPAAPLDDETRLGARAFEVTLGTEL